MARPRVSVLFTTYNHERWVAQALASVLQQSLAGEVEIVWQDDASTDGTVAVVEALLAGCTIPVTRLLRQNNRMGRGVPCHMDLIEAARGNYLAVLEGDDLWCDPDKLRLQVQALDSQPGIDLCFARARVVADGAAIDAPAQGFLSDLGDAPGVAALSAVIRGDGGYMHTSSLLVRRQALTGAPRWFFEFQPIGDYMIQVLGATRGGALYLPQVLSHYRTQVGGSWSERVAQSPDARAAFEVGFIRLLRRMQQHYGPAHKDDFDAILFNHLAALTRISVFHDRPVPLVQAATALLAA